MWGGNLLCQCIVNKLVNPELLILQIELRKKLVLVEKIVADQRILLQSVGYHVVLLSISAEKEENLGGEGVALSVLVELRQEGILLEHFQEQLPSECLVNQPRQRGLSHPDRAFDRHVVVSFHGTISSSIAWVTLPPHIHRGAHPIISSHPGSA